MNYIKEVNAFHNRLETNPLSTAAANLWHVLMHVNNRAGWLEEFTVAVSVLCAKASLTESTFKRARTELQERGYIRYRSRGGNRAAVYQIVSLVGLVDKQAGANGVGVLENTNEVKVDDSRIDVQHGIDGNMIDNVSRSLNESMNGNVSDSLDGNMNDSVSDRMDHNVAPLIKQNKTKQNQNTTTTTDAIAFYQENFGMISSFIAEDIINWINDLGEPLVLEAMKIAQERGKANWGYTKAILQAWANKGINTIQAAKAEQQQFQHNQKAQKQRQTRPYNKEIVPTWFQVQKKQENSKHEKTENVESAEIARLLAEVSGTRGTLSQFEC